MAEAVQLEEMKHVSSSFGLYGSAVCGSFQHRQSCSSYSSCLLLLEVDQPRWLALDNFRVRKRNALERRTDAQARQTTSDWRALQRRG